MIILEARRRKHGAVWAVKRRKPNGFDLINAMAPSLLLVAGILYTAWCEWWI